MPNKLCTIQFPHPGSEPKKNALEQWNTGAHTRKFLLLEGAYLDTGKLKTDKLTFWAEWEPQSTIVETFPHLKNHPHFLLAPYYQLSDKSKNKQNTDPFVFGNQFLYSNCRQKNTGVLRNLGRGSVILFGSHVDKHFVLDTVFVVADSKNYSADTISTLVNDVPKEFFDVTLNVLKRNCCNEENGCSKSKNLTLYFGATFENPINGMFSFFPCLPYIKNQSGFPRPQIKMDELITDTLSRNFKHTAHEKIEVAYEIWQEVREQVINQGLKMGVQAELPKERK